MFRRQGRRILAIFITLAFLIGIMGWRQYVWNYPYGWSHCCDKALSNVLYEYALAHDGAFPTGEATPEASLSLLYPKYADANLLRGKTVPVATAQQILERGDRLRPESCGWRYVEGLRIGDRQEIAIFWDKAKLGHNSERNLEGGATVFFVDGSHEYIRGFPEDARNTNT